LKAPPEHLRLVALAQIVAQAHLKPIPVQLKLTAQAHQGLTVARLEQTVARLEQTAVHLEPTVVRQEQTLAHLEPAVATQ
jgi:hypothetical protein